MDRRRLLQGTAAWLVARPLTADGQTLTPPVPILSARVSPRP